MKSRWIALLMSLCLTVQAAPASGKLPDKSPNKSTGELPGDSLYQLQFNVTTQEGRQHRLDLYRGQVTLVSMFYGSCPDVCPLLIDSVRDIDNQLSAIERQRLRVLLVSFDPARDSPKILRELAAVHHLDESRWTLARAEEMHVRQLASALNIQYRKVPDGSFNHSTAITLLDNNGRIVARTDHLGRADAGFLAKIKTALQSTPQRN